MLQVRPKCCNESSFHQNKIERWWLENYHLKSIILSHLKESHLSPSLSFLFNKTLENVNISWIIEVDSVTRLVKDGVLKAIQWKLARYQHRFHEYRYEWNSGFMHIFLNGLQAYMIRQRMKDECSSNNRINIPFHCTKWTLIKFTHWMTSNWSSAYCTNINPKHVWALWVTCSNL